MTLREALEIFFDMFEVGRSMTWEVFIASVDADLLDELAEAA